MEKIVFMHLPKTGGSSLHQVLVDIFGDSRICPLRHNLLDQLPQQAKEAYQVFSGHFYYDAIIEEIKAPKKIVCLLRDPVSRLLSCYYFGRSHTRQYIAENPVYSRKPDCYTFHGMSYAAAKELDLKAYLESERPFLSNLMTNWIGGFQGSDAQKLSRAKARIEVMDAFGLLEAFDRSVQVIMQALNLPEPQHLPREKSFEKLVQDAPHAMEMIEKEQPTEDTQNLLEEITSLDRELYAFARELFQDRY